MFGIGMMELLLIGVVALVVVGPQKLPELMKQLGKIFVQIRQMTTEVRDSMETVIHDAEQEIEREKREKAFAEAKPVPPRDSTAQESASEQGADGEGTSSLTQTQAYESHSHERSHGFATEEASPTSQSPGSE
ncbi:MAG: Sec-independent protein translocase protein TatB [Zetaproteobacteria bacterium]|nr:Sec-independent protein translocase protein TatB [Zetaproteobacteria bacterium]